MKLNELIYLIIKPDGTCYFVKRNDQYYNHSEYLKELSRQNDYLKTCSFGLTFSKDNNLPNIYFFKELVSDGCIIFENHKILSSLNVSSSSFYLPSEISTQQDTILESFMEEMNTIKNIFLERYNGDTQEFGSIIENKEDLQSGNRKLKEYIKTHKLEEEKYRK